ncbi:MAG: cyclic lactone autoinducer peptide [Syntrophomonadaceae bacterium]|nr:cyclic lactone autoinducer peptide [Syntrophomonadaceae bacterium]
MKRWKMVLLGSLVTLLSWLASANAASASTVVWYQPEVPAALRR